jgi:hypothetical protein
MLMVRLRGREMAEAAVGSNALFFFQSKRPGVCWKALPGSTPLRQTRRTALSALARGVALLHPHLCLLLGACAATVLSAQLTGTR